MDELLTLDLDGSGGFPLGAVFSGILPLWASEIEPFPDSRDHQAPALDATSGGHPQYQRRGDRPCGHHHLRLAMHRYVGRRKRRAGRQAICPFHEAIRIIREMRNATHGKYPRFIVWENVPGAFSSNRARISARFLPPSSKPPSRKPRCLRLKSGWPAADVLLGNGWSVAYRTVDAQHFGVAQRRRRIYLVADFGSERAGDSIEREGVSRILRRASCGEAAAGTSCGSRWNNSRV